MKVYISIIKSPLVIYLVLAMLFQCDKIAWLQRLLENRTISLQFVNRIAYSKGDIVIPNTNRKSKINYCFYSIL